MRSNRTFMELKLLTSKLCGDLLGSNRTFMELKLVLSLPVLFARLRSNRTFMELKLAKTLKLFVCSVKVLIAPLWN